MGDGTRHDAQGGGKQAIKQPMPDRGGYGDDVLLWQSAALSR